MFLIFHQNPHPIRRSGCYYISIVQFICRPILTSLISPPLCLIITMITPNTITALNVCISVPEVLTGYKRVRQFSLPAETVRHIWLPPSLSAIPCFLPRLLCLGNSFLQRLSVWFSFLPRDSAGSIITRTVSAGSHLLWTVVSAGRERSRTVSAEAKYDIQSLQEVKISGLTYTLWCCTYSKDCSFCLPWWGTIRHREQGPYRMKKGIWILWLF